MDARKELGDLIRAMARSDWGTIDRLTNELRELEWAGAVPMIGAAFTLAVHRRFQPGQDLRDIARFVSATRAEYEEGEKLPALDMEGIIRAALGETDLMDSVDPGISLQVQIVLLGTLLQDENLTEAQLEQFIKDVEETAAEYL